MAKNPPCECFAYYEGECGCDHDWTNYDELAKAWELGYQRGFRDAEGDLEKADNPYEGVYE